MATTGAATLILAIVTFSQGSSAFELRPSKNPVSVGDNVTLELFPSSSTHLGVYLLNGNAFLLWSNSSEKTISAKASINFTSGTLSLFSVSVAQSGVYEIQSFNPKFQANGSITVLEPASNVTLKANASNLVEHNDTVTLTCSALGSSLSYHWRNGSSDIKVNDRVHLSDNNQTLSISNVLRFDTGPFYCIASNYINNATSPPLHLNISYGPEDIVLSVSVATWSDFYRTGENITLSCTAVSSPPAEYLWAFNAALLKNTGPYEKLENVHLNQSGNYTCWAHNTQTLQYISKTTSLLIKEPVSNVTLKANATDLVEFNDSVILTCSALGSSLSYHWRNGSSDIKVNDRVHLSDNNQTLTISDVLRFDTGPFYCMASNEFSNGTSPPLHLNISYGPENIVLSVSGDKSKCFHTGENISLSCSAVSSPPAEFSWFFNGAFLKTTGPSENLEKVKESQSGNYTCQAHNIKTLRYISKTTSVCVKGSGSRQGFSAGLLFGTFLVLILFDWPKVF